MDKVKKLNTFLKLNMQTLISFRTKNEIKNFLIDNGFKLSDNDLQNLIKNFNINFSDRNNLSLDDLNFVAGGIKHSSLTNKSEFLTHGPHHLHSRLTRAGKTVLMCNSHIYAQKASLFEDNLLKHAEMRRQLYRSYDCDILKARIRELFNELGYGNFRSVVKVELKQERFKKDGATRSSLEDRLSDATDRFGPEYFTAHKVAKFIELTYKDGKTCTLDALLFN